PCRRKSRCPRDRGPGVPSIIQSLPLELTRTADVSPSAVTFSGRKLLISFVDGQNRTQEADGSIPFISTKLLSIFSFVSRFETIFGSIVSNQEASRPPLRTV